MKLTQPPVHRVDIDIANLVLDRYVAIKPDPHVSLSRVAVQAIRDVYRASAKLYEGAAFARAVHFGLYTHLGELHQEHVSKNISILAFPALRKAAIGMESYERLGHNPQDWYSNTMARIDEQLAAAAYWVDQSLPEQTDVAILAQAALEFATVLRPVLMWAQLDEAVQFLVDRFWRNESTVFTISPAWLTLVHNAHNRSLADSHSTPTETPVNNIPQPAGGDRAVFIEAARQTANGEELNPGLAAAKVESQRDSFVATARDAVEHYVGDLGGERKDEVVEAIVTHAAANFDAQQEQVPEPPQASVNPDYLIESFRLLLQIPDVHTGNHPALTPRDVMRALQKVSLDNRVNGSSLTRLLGADFARRMEVFDDAGEQIPHDIEQCYSEILRTLASYQMLHECLSGVDMLMRHPGPGEILGRLGKFMEGTIDQIGEQLYAAIAELATAILKRNTNVVYANNAAMPSTIDMLLGEANPYGISPELRRALSTAVATVLAIPAQTGQPLGGYEAAAADIAAAAFPESTPAGVTLVETIEVAPDGQCTNADAILTKWPTMPLDARRGYWKAHTPEQRRALYNAIPTGRVSSAGSFELFDIGAFMQQVEEVGGFDAPTELPSLGAVPVNIELNGQGLCTNGDAVLAQWQAMDQAAQKAYWVTQPLVSRHAWVAHVGATIEFPQLDEFLASTKAAGGFESYPITAHPETVAVAETQAATGIPEVAPEPETESRIIARFYRDRWGHKEAFVFPVVVPGLTYMPQQCHDFEHITLWAIQCIEANELPNSVLSSITGPGGVTIDVLVAVGHAKEPEWKDHFVITVVNTGDRELIEQITGYLTNPGSYEAAHSNPPEVKPHTTEITETVTPVPHEPLQWTTTATLGELAGGEPIKLATIQMDHLTHEVDYRFEEGPLIRLNAQSLQHIVYWMYGLDELGSWLYQTTVRTVVGNIVPVTVDLTRVRGSEGDLDSFVVIYVATDEQIRTLPSITIPTAPPMAVSSDTDPATVKLEDWVVKLPPGAVAKPADTVTPLTATDVYTSKGPSDDDLVAQMEVDCAVGIVNLLASEIRFGFHTAAPTVSDLEPIAKWVIQHFADGARDNLTENFSIPIAGLGTEIMVNVYASRNRVNPVIDVNVHRIDRKPAQRVTAPVQSVRTSRELIMAADEINANSTLPPLGQVSENARDRLRQAVLAAGGLVDPRTQSALQSQAAAQDDAPVAATASVAAATIGDLAEELMHWVVTWIGNDKTIRGPLIDRKATAMLHKHIRPIVALLPAYHETQPGLAGKYEPDEHCELAFGTVLLAAEVAMESKEAMLQNPRVLNWLTDYVLQQRIYISAELVKEAKAAKAAETTDPTVNDL